MRPIDADNLMEYCNNQKSRAIDCNDIARFPTLDVKPVIKGKWIDKTYGFGCDAECDQCHKRANGYFRDNGFGNDYYFYDFCPNCGSDMREIEE